MGANGVAPTAPTAVRERVHHRQRRVGDLRARARSAAGVVVVVVRRRRRGDDGGELGRRRFRVPPRAVIARVRARTVTAGPGPGARRRLARGLAGEVEHTAALSGGGARRPRGAGGLDDELRRRRRRTPSSSRNAVNASVAASSLATTSARSLSPGGGVRLVARWPARAPTAQPPAPRRLTARGVPIPFGLIFLPFRTFLDGARHRSSTPSSAHGRERRRGPPSRATPRRNAREIRKPPSPSPNPRSRRSGQNRVCGAQQRRPGPAAARPSARGAAMELELRRPALGMDRRRAPRPLAAAACVRDIVRRRRRF